VDASARIGVMGCGRDGRRRILVECASLAALRAQCGGAAELCDASVILSGLLHEP
jgi:hypothetical protein